MLRSHRLSQARKELIRLGLRSIVLYIWRPEFANDLDLVSHDVSVYHLDDEYTFSTIDLPVSDTESMLINRVDRVFVHSITLQNKKAGAIQSALVPNGVDFVHYSRIRRIPEDLAAIPSPRIGYIGVVKKQLDLRLLLDLAKARRDWSFVFVGPNGALHGASEDLRELHEQPNCYFLGGRTHAELPAYVQGMDVCTMCYRLDDYTKYIYPLKLNEYLAAGKPVVSVRLPGISSVGNAVFWAQGKSEWLRQIEGILQGGEELRAALETGVAIAAAHDWSVIADQVEQEIRQAVDQSHQVSSQLV